MPQNLDLSSSRFSSDDLKKIEEALTHLGDEAEGTFRRLEQSLRGPDEGLATLEGSIGGVGDGFRDIANSGGPLSGALAKIGPLGIAAGAGLTVMAAGIERSLAFADKAREHYAELALSAEQLATNVETLQALEFFANSRRFDGVNAQLERFAQAQLEAASGTGKVTAALKDQDPELLRAIANARSQQEVMELSVRALREARSELERNSVADALFGGAASESARFFEELPGNIDEATVAARRLGQVIDEDVVRSVAETDRRLLEIREQIDGNLRAGSLGLVEISTRWNQVLLETSKIYARIGQGLSGIGGDLSNTLSDELRRRVEENREILAEYRELVENPNIATPVLAGLRGPGVLIAQERLAEAQTELNRRALDRWIADASDKITEFSREIEARAGRTADGLRSAEATTGIFTDALGKDAAVRADEAERAAARRAREAARELNRAQEAAIRIRGELGDITGLLAAREAELARYVELGTLTKEQAVAALERYRDELDGSAAAEARWARVVEGSATAAGRLAAQIRQLKEDRAADRIEVELYEDALEALRNRQREMEAEARSREAAEKKRAEERRRREFEQSEGFRRATDIQRAALDDMINGTDRLGDVFKRVMAEMILDALGVTAALNTMRDQLARILNDIAGGGSSGGGFSPGNIFTTILDGGFGGGFGGGSGFSGVSSGGVWGGGGLDSATGRGPIGLSTSPLNSAPLKAALVPIPVGSNQKAGDTLVFHLGSDVSDAAVQKISGAVEAQDRRIRQIEVTREDSMRAFMSKQTIYGGGY